MSRPNIGDRFPIGAVGDAQKEHVLEGKTFSSEAAGIEAVGTMPNRGQAIITPGTSNIAIPAGYHDGTGYVKGDANLIAANIVAGKSIFGVVGSHWGGALEPSSSNIVHSFNTIGLIADSEYRKIKEVQINRGSGKIYVTAEHFSPNGGDNVIRVTRNGTIVMSDNRAGTSNISVSVSGQVDISLGDKIAVHCRTTKEGAFLLYFRIGYNVVPRGGPDKVLL